MNSNIKSYLLVLFLGINQTVSAMQFLDPIHIKEFIKDNATKAYFQSMLESIQDPISSIVAHNGLLNHAKVFLTSPEFNPALFRSLPEGCFKMALRLIYAATYRDRKSVV